MAHIEQTTAAQALSAWAILDKKGHSCGKVLAHYSGRGTVKVEVHLWGDALTKETAEAMGYTFGDDDKITSYNGQQVRQVGEYAYTVAALQTGSAGGSGYDKLTSALSGLYIGKHRMTDHCGDRLKRPKGKLWQESDRERLRKKGYTVANYVGAIPEGPEGAKYNRYGREGVPDSASGYVDAYRMHGFGYPAAVGGYQFIQVL